jgi:hypothetical protein
VLPYVITTSTTLVDNQTAATALQAIQAAEPYAPSTAPPACNSTPAPASVIDGLQATGEPGPKTLATLLTACNSTHSLTSALTAAGGLTNPQVAGLLAYNPLAKAIQDGQTVSQSAITSKVGVHSQNLASLLVAEQKLVPAQKAAPGEWQRWWGVCLAGMFVFAVLVFFMRGRWSPRAARRDLAEHDEMVTRELANLTKEPAGVS